jgi:hypothetical protein
MNITTTERISARRRSHRNKNFTGGKFNMPIEITVSDVFGLGGRHSSLFAFANH